ncbi:hypothetical protein ACNQT2_11675, partial [Corynebacterium diphtheriae]
LICSLPPGTTIRQRPRWHITSKISDDTVHFWIHLLQQTDMLTTTRHHHPPATSMAHNVQDLG